MKKNLFLLILFLSTHTIFTFLEKPFSKRLKHLSTQEMKEYNDLPELRLSSFNTISDKDELEFKLKMKSKYIDEYHFTTKNIKQTTIYDENGSIITQTTKSEFNLLLGRNKILFINYEATDFNLDISSTIVAKNHFSLLPYDPVDLNDKVTYDTSYTNEDPLKPAEIKYTKRPGGLYIYDNNPEEVTDTDLNQAFIRTNFSDIEVFFTMEHFSKIQKAQFTGYQIRNIGKEDLYITVRNIGYQLNGTGGYFGEMEWIHFFNTKFRLLYKDTWTESQKSNFQAYIGFSDKHEPKNFQPITYRIPPGKHFYVMGGTTADSYNNINVFDTADKMFIGGNINGVVLFDVRGSAEGVYYIYDDYKNVQEDNKSNMPYIVFKPYDPKNYGAQYKGYDNCHGVVDSNVIWEFNDDTESQFLPVNVTNYYKDNLPQPETPYSKIDSTRHTNIFNSWDTNANPQNGKATVGTDLTDFHTFDSENISRVIDNDHYDGRGYKSNTANWMIDYIEGYNFVNRGDNERKVTVKVHVLGALASMVRNSRGDVINGTQQFAIGVNPSAHGDALFNELVYSQNVKPHDTLKFYVEYALMACSYGNVTHSVYLE